MHGIPLENLFSRLNGDPNPVFSRYQGGGRSLVIDMGFTTVWLAAIPGGEIDYSLARRISPGIQNALADFEEVNV